MNRTEMASVENLMTFSGTVWICQCIGKEWRIDEVRFLPPAAPIYEKAPPPVGFLVAGDNLSVEFIPKYADNTDWFAKNAGQEIETPEKRQL